MILNEVQCAHKNALRFKRSTRKITSIKILVITITVIYFLYQ